ncbi:MAG TPA: hypothetical protein VHS96_00995 [Bacteroidia bacterium]|nr:hypothetical protein [Bacteroidia bacterium]
MKQLLKLKAMGLLIMLLAIGYVKAQSLTPQEPIRQGGLADPSVDAAGYDAHKAQFVAEHPEQYNQMIGNQTIKEVTPQGYPWGAPENKESWIAAHPREFAEYTQKLTDNRVRMTRAEFNAFPAAKQEAILKDANYIIID